MKKKPMLFNYTLSIGFILLIIVFIMSLILISRYVLSEKNAIGNYVSDTKTLLEDVNEVGVKVDENIQIEQKIETKNQISIKYNNYQENILDVSYANTKENKSVITIILDSNMYVENGTYYIMVKNISQIKEGYEIVYLNNLGEIDVGKVFLVSDVEGIKVFNVETKEVVVINPKSILGKVVLEHGN